MSTFKGRLPHVGSDLLTQINNLKHNKKNVIKTQSRKSTILPGMVNLSMGVYNGKIYIPVDIKEDMIGHKLGEFSITRTFKGHAGDKKGKKVTKK